MPVPTTVDDNKSPPPPTAEEASAVAGGSTTTADASANPTKKICLSNHNHETNKASLAPFNPTCDQAQNIALEMLQIDDSKEEVLFDLGCGDARMLLYAAQKIPTLKCVGIELDPIFVERGRDALQKLPESVQARVDIRQGDLMELMKEKEEVDQNKNTSNNATETGDDASLLGRDCKHLSLFKDATAIYMFLLPRGIKVIQPILNALAEKRKQEQRPLRFVAYMFSIREWEPVTVDRSTKGDAPLYLYQFLPEVAGDENKKE